MTNKWRKIKSAPKDGTIILVTTKDFYSGEYSPTNAARWIELPEVVVPSWSSMTVPMTASAGFFEKGRWISSKVNLVTTTVFKNDDDRVGAPQKELHAAYHTVYPTHWRPMPQKGKSK